MKTKTFNKTAIKIAMGALLGVAGAAFAQTADQVPAKYKARIEALKAKGEDLKKTEQPSAVGATLGIDAKVKFGLQTINVPVPELTMKLQQIIMHVPEFKWAETRIGPIVMHLPQTWMSEQRFELHVPEFKMGNLEIKLHLPEVTFSDARINIEQTKEKGKALAKEAQNLSKEMKAELLEKQKGPLLQKKQEALTQIDAAIKGFQAMIDHVKAAKGEVGELLTKLQDLAAQREKVSKQFDDALKQLGL